MLSFVTLFLEQNVTHDLNRYHISMSRSTIKYLKEILLNQTNKVEPLLCLYMHLNEFAPKNHQMHFTCTLAKGPSFP